MIIGDIQIPEAEEMDPILSGIVFYRPTKQMQVWDKGKIYAYCFTTLGSVENQIAWLKYMSVYWKEYVVNHAPLVPPE